MQKKLFTAIIALTFTATLVSPQVAFGQGKSGAEEIFDYSETKKNNNDNGQSSAENFIGDEVVGNIFNELAVQAGGDPTDPNSRSAIDGMSKMIAGTFNQPASTKQYIAMVMEDMKIAKPAYAQGLGFSSLTPLLELWKLSRNIAYIFFVLVFLFIGFAIMLRQNLGGQAAVTVQQALPRIIVALLMVTFSYAIAGLAIDLMYIVMFFLVAMFSQGSLLDSTLTDFGNNGNILSQNIFQVYGGIITGNFAGNAGQVIAKTVDTMLSGSGSVGDALADGVSWVSGILGTLIIFFAILFAMFRTFFSLAKVYIEIILSIAFAPLILMMGAVQSNVFGNWIKGLMANLAVFPAMLVFIIIGYLLVGDQAQLTANLNDSGFVPPFLPGRGAVNTIGLVAGIGAIMLLPEVATIVGRFKPKSIFDDLGGMAWKNAMAGRGVGQAIGAVGLGAGAGLAGGAVVGSINAARALRAGEGGAEAWNRLKRDTYRGTIGGAGAGVLGGGGLRYGQKAISTIGSISRDAKSSAEMWEAYRISRATDKERNVPQEDTPGTTPGSNSSTTDNLAYRPRTRSNTSSTRRDRTGGK